MASMGSNLAGQPGELRMVIEIKRKETGAVETVELVGHADPEKLKQILENEHGSHALNGST